MNEISPIGEEKIMITREKLVEITTFLTKPISLPEPKVYPRIYGDCNCS